MNSELLSIVRPKSFNDYFSQLADDDPRCLSPSFQHS